MTDHANVWPAVGDPRLLRVLEKQLIGALEDLHGCTEDGLGRLAQAMEQHPKSVIIPHIMQALTDLQKIDRVKQRLGNVVENLSDWAATIQQQTHEPPAWANAVSSHFVMPEEGAVLRSVLRDEEGEGQEKNGSAS